MKKKTTKKVARGKIPTFRSKAEEAAFWSRHDSTKYLKETKEVKGVTFTRTKKKLVSLRLDEKTVAMLKSVAAHKGIGYLPLLRLWVMEKLHEEQVA